MAIGGHTHLAEEFPHAPVHLLVIIVEQGDDLLGLGLERHPSEGYRDGRLGREGAVLADGLEVGLDGRRVGRAQEGVASEYIGIVELGVAEKELENLERTSGFSAAYRRRFGATSIRAWQNAGQRQGREGEKREARRLRALTKTAITKATEQMWTRGRAGAGGSLWSGSREFRGLQLGAIARHEAPPAFGRDSFVVLRAMASSRGAGMCEWGGEGAAPQDDVMGRAAVGCMYSVVRSSWRQPTGGKGCRGREESVERRRNRLGLVGREGRRDRPSSRRRADYAAAQQERRRSRGEKAAARRRPMRKSPSSPMCRCRAGR